jgi:hypothetical protein
MQPARGSPQLGARLWTAKAAITNQPSSPQPGRLDAASPALHSQAPGSPQPGARLSAAMAELLPASRLSTARAATSCYHHGRPNDAFSKTLKPDLAKWIGDVRFISESPDRRIAGPPDRRIAGSPGTCRKESCRQARIIKNPFVKHE